MKQVHARILVWIALCCALAACGESIEQQMLREQQQALPRYEVIELDGVRCVVYAYATSNQPVACHWDKED